MATRYRVYKKEKLYGKEHMGIERSTFVIDKTGTIRNIYGSVRVQDHADKVLEFVRSLG